MRFKSLRRPEFRIAFLVLLVVSAFNVSWGYAESKVVMDESGAYVSGAETGQCATELMAEAMNTSVEMGILGESGVKISAASLTRYGVTIAAFIIVVVCVGVGVNSIRSAKYVY